MQEVSNHLPYLRHVLEQRLYPRLEMDPRKDAWYDRHRKFWHVRFAVVGPLLTVQAHYTIDDERRLVTMQGLDVVDYQPDPN